MSRIQEILSFVKSDLGQYDKKDVNKAQIYYAINKGQEQIIMNEGILSDNITVPMVNGQAQYPLWFNTGGANPINLPIVKKILSIQYPDNWCWDTQWKTPQQFDEVKSYHPHSTHPHYVTMRPHSVEYGTQYLEFFGAPVVGTTPISIKLQCELSRQIADASDTVDLTTPYHYDKALRFFAVDYLLPLDSPIKGILKELYDAEIRQYSGKFLNLDGYARTPECRW